MWIFVKRKMVKEIIYWFKWRYDKGKRRIIENRTYGIRENKIKIIRRNAWS